MLPALEAEGAPSDRPEMVAVNTARQHTLTKAGDLMSLKESQARLKASRTIPDHWWWNGADLAPFFDLVQKVGAENVTIRAVPGLNAEGYSDLHLVVLNATTGEVLGEFNYSYPCPPVCELKRAEG